jgi:hypothetical protein
MANEEKVTNKSLGRRKFLKGGMLAGGAALGAGLIGSSKSAFAQSTSSLTKGDVAVLRFLAAAELIEADLWTQYAELGGLTSGVPVEVDPNQSPNPYQAALSNLDTDGPQYITSNTIDEISHANFLNAYLEFVGADPVNLDEFRILPSSQASGAQDIGRLTNLMKLNVDTSWFIRYRSSTNPDFGVTYPQAITITNKPAIPRTDADMDNTNLIQVIANTAAFHFGAIEQGGSSLYPALATKVSSTEVLQILLSIGGDEIAHFLEWVDFAGNGVQAPVAPVSAGGLTFPDFFTKGPLFQPSLIFPVPCAFVNFNLPHCAVIRPIADVRAGAVATAQFFTDMNLFAGQPKAFFSQLQTLAEAADAARR